jgi:hypothetical protein
MLMNSDVQRLCSMGLQCCTALLISLFSTLAGAAPFDYYLKCDIRERTVHPPSTHHESFVKVERYVVCMIEAVKNSSQVATDDVIIKGPQYDGRRPDDMNCTQLKNRKATLTQRISDLRKYQTEGRAAVESLVAGQMEAERVAAESETIRVMDQQQCDIAKEDFENLVSMSPRPPRCRGRDAAAIADCIDRAGSPTPEYLRLRAEKTRLCNAATVSTNRAIEARESVATVVDYKRKMEAKLRTIQTEINKANVELNRIREAMAEKSCPR